MKLMVEMTEEEYDKFRNQKQTANPKYADQSRFIADICKKIILCLNVSQIQSSCCDPLSPPTIHVSCDNNLALELIKIAKFKLNN